MGTHQLAHVEHALVGGYGLAKELEHGLLLGRRRDGGGVEVFDAAVEEALVDVEEFRTGFGESLGQASFGGGNGLERFFEGVVGLRGGRRDRKCEPLFEVGEVADTGEGDGDRRGGGACGFDPDATDCAWLVEEGDGLEEDEDGGGTDDGTDHTDSDGPADEGTERVLGFPNDPGGPGDFGGADEREPAFRGTSRCCDAYGVTVEGSAGAKGRDGVRRRRDDRG
jgi:hypothetical protein